MQFSTEARNILGLTLPNDEHPPPPLFETPNGFSVAFYVSAQFGFPIFLARCRYPPIPARMLVPEATMNENDLSTWAEHKVRFSGQVLPMEPVAIAH